MCFREAGKSGAEAWGSEIEFGTALEHQYAQKHVPLVQLVVQVRSACERPSMAIRWPFDSPLMAH